eukprot:21957-Hanusia_phi.AAC.1
MRSARYQFYLVTRGSAGDDEVLLASSSDRALRTVPGDEPESPDRTSRRRVRGAAVPDAFGLTGSSCTISWSLARGRCRRCCAWQRAAAAEKARGEPDDRTAGSGPRERGLATSRLLAVAGELGPVSRAP